MSSTDILSMFAMLLGGLTFFLFGMSIMSTGLEQMAGSGLEKTLNRVAKNDFSGFMLGAGITVAIQSSSAMTVMLVGLVNSGILLFENTFGMIMGSHVGTTLTAWILTLNANSGGNFFMALLKPMNFAPILAFFGIILKMTSKKAKRRSLGDIFIGFAIIMVGMNMMSESMANVREYSGLLTFFSASPILAFLISTAFTGAIQSSAATVAIVQAFALSIGLDYLVAIPLIIGANVGTCMTALLSSIGTNKNAKRVVAMHTYTNAIGGVLFMVLLYIVKWFRPDLLTVKTSIIGVAVIHSLFNILNALAFTPFKKPMIRLCKKTVKGDDNDKTHTVFLDERIFNNTPLAISECQRLTNEMASICLNSVTSATKLLTEYNETIAENISNAEDIIDKYEDKLGTYLLKLSVSELNEKDSFTTARMLHAIGDFERIGDHALNIVKSAGEIIENKIIFPPEVINELNVITSALKEILSLSIGSFINGDSDTASHVEPLEQVIDSLRDTIKARHVKRLQHGETTIKTGFIFSDILTDYERVSDHCSNIAAYILQEPTLKFDNHKYLNRVKSEKQGAFALDYKRFEEKYSL